MPSNPSRTSAGLYRQIADQISGLIASGEFQQAARLPSERDLAVQLGVSRPSVREALIALEVEGKVDVRVGSGIYVARRRPAAAIDPDRQGQGPFELLRARWLIEGEIAAEAARRGQPETWPVFALPSTICRDGRSSGATWTLPIATFTLPSLRPATTALFSPSSVICGIKDEARSGSAWSTTSRRRSYDRPCCATIGRSSKRSKRATRVPAQLDTSPPRAGEPRVHSRMESPRQSRVHAADDTRRRRNRSRASGVWLGPADRAGPAAVPAARQEVVRPLDLTEPSSLWLQMGTYTAIRLILSLALTSTLLAACGYGSSGTPSGTGNATGNATGTGGHITPTAGTSGTGTGGTNTGAGGEAGTDPSGEGGVGPVAGTGGTSSTGTAGGQAGTGGSVGTGPAVRPAPPGRGAPAGTPAPGPPGAPAPPGGKGGTTGTPAPPGAPAPPAAAAPPPLRIGAPRLSGGPSGTGVTATVTVNAAPRPGRSAFTGFGYESTHITNDSLNNSNKKLIGLYKLLGTPDRQAGRQRRDQVELWRNRKRSVESAQGQPFTHTVVSGMIDQFCNFLQATGSRSHLRRQLPVRQRLGIDGRGDVRHEQVRLQHLGHRARQRNRQVRFLVQPEAKVGDSGLVLDRHSERVDHRSGCRVERRHQLHRSIHRGRGGQVRQQAARHHEPLLQWRCQYQRGDGVDVTESEVPHHEHLHEREQCAPSRPRFGGRLALRRGQHLLGPRPDGRQRHHHRSALVARLLVSDWQHGGNGIDWHGGEVGQDGTRPFYYAAVAESGGQVTGVQPLFYGLLLFANAGTGSVLSTTVSSSNTNFTAYAVKGNGYKSVVLVNRNATMGVTATVNVGAPSARPAPRAIYLQGTPAGSLSAGAGQVTLAGSTVATDGVWNRGAPYPGHLRGTPRPYTYRRSPRRWFASFLEPPPDLPRQTHGSRADDDARRARNR